MAFGQQDSSYPQATISLSDTNLMTPDPTSPESSYNVKEEQGEDGEPRKPTKKRKSWGQELPTPKTNLPPRYDMAFISNNCASTYDTSRKRAKTEDEKEQRRIERVLRNRQAAQSSRERKRQEVEKLEGEKQSIEQQNAALKQQLMTVEHEKWLLRQQVAKMTAQMEAIKRGSSTPDVSTPPLEPDHEQIIKKEFDDYQFALPTPRSSLRASSTSFSSPSTATYSGSSTPATISLGLDALTASPDMTQHPAAMLCDLQCQSLEVCHVSTRPTIRHAAAIQLYTANLLCLTLISQVYLQLMRPLKMIFTSLRTGSPLLTDMMTSMPMALPLIQWLISTPANLLPHPPPIQPTRTTATTTTIPTTTTSPTTATSTLPTTPSQTPILRLRMLQRLLLSSPSLARPLRAATGQASRLKTDSTTSGRSGISRSRLQSIVRRYSENAGLIRRRRSSGDGSSIRRNDRSSRVGRDKSNSGTQVRQNRNKR